MLHSSSPLIIFLHTTHISISWLAFFEQIASGETELASCFCLMGLLDVIFPNSAPQQLFQQTRRHHSYEKLSSKPFRLLLVDQDATVQQLERLLDEFFRMD